jgi:hypothetical protein
VKSVKVLLGNLFGLTINGKVYRRWENIVVSKLCSYGEDRTGWTSSFWCMGGRSQWPRGLRRRSAAERLLGSWVRIPPGAWMNVCVVM